MGQSGNRTQFLLTPPVAPFEFLFFKIFCAFSLSQNPNIRILTFRANFFRGREAAER